MRQWCRQLFANHPDGDLPLCTKLLALLFADDTTLLASGPNLPDLIQLVNDELVAVFSYI